MDILSRSKVLVKSFNCEDRSCYVGNRQFAKVGHYESYCIHIQLLKGYHPLPPGAPAGEGCRRISVWFWFGSLCGAVLWTFTIPFIGSSRASKGEASPQPEAHPCWHCLTLLSEASRNKLQVQQPSFQKWGFASWPNTKAPGVCFSSDAPSADGWVRIGIFSHKFSESSPKERAKVKVHFEGGDSVSLPKKCLMSNHLPWIWIPWCELHVYKATKKWSLIWRNLAGDEWIFIRGIVAQHGFRERYTWSSRKFRARNNFIREERLFPDKKQDQQII